MWVELARHGVEQLATITHPMVHALPDQPPPTGVPGDTGATAPPGIGNKFATLLGDVKWVALAAIILTFFAGIAVFTAGRVADHRHGAANGTKLMIASAAGAVLYAIGYGVITGLAG